MAYSMMLDAGHGGEDPGAVYDNRQEKDNNLELVLALGKILSEHGIEIKYTRTTDIYETPYEKAVKANKAGVDFFLSIHRNSFPQANTANGVESLVYDLSGLKLEMGENINQQLETVGFQNLGVKARPNLIVLRRTTMPALLVEIGFINSDIDNKIYDEHFNQIVQALANGILMTLQENELLPPGDPPAIHPSKPQMQIPDGPSCPLYPQTEYTYRVQVGAFRNPHYAQRLLKELLEQDYPAYVSEGNGFFRVQVGHYDSLEEAIKMEQHLKMAGYSTIVLR